MWRNNVDAPPLVSRQAQGFHAKEGATSMKT
jgi:hypothetical protein